METKISTDFSVAMHKKPKVINDDETAIVLYTPEQIKLKPCESVIANMQIKVKLPRQIRGTILLLQSLSRQSLSIENQMLIRETCSNIKIDLLNKKFGQNITIKKNTKITFLVILNKGNEKFSVKYEIIKNQVKYLQILLYFLPNNNNILIYNNFVCIFFYLTIYF